MNVIGIVRISPEEIITGVNVITDIAQSACVAPSIPSGIAFVYGNQVSKALEITLPIETFRRISDIALDSTGRLVGNNLNTRWIAPISVMVAFSLIPCAFYVIPTTLTSFVLTGAICGAHSLVMDLFANGTSNRSGAFSFKDSLRDIFIFSEQERLMNNDVLRHLDGSIKKKANLAGSVALLVSTVALTLLFKNPFLANAIAYPISAAVNVAAERFFREEALVQNEAPVRRTEYVPRRQTQNHPTGAIVRYVDPETNELIMADGRRLPNPRNMLNKEWIPD